MKKILVTGANGQLGQCLKKQSNDFKSLDFVFLGSSQLDITNGDQINSVFKESDFDFCINCAAYTAVDNAEDEKQTAHKVNTLGPKNLAEACKKFDVHLMHISTDFVFDGNTDKPYKETETTNPIGVYGDTKLEGEKLIASILDNFYIIRTSWLYSEYNNNFVKTMLRLASEREELSIVNDQFGTPTNANDLAKAIIKIIENGNTNFGVYHYSNLGVATWFKFAEAIFKITNTKIKINPVSTEAFKTKAKRPKYSVLDKTKIIKAFDLEIPNWELSLEEHLKIKN